MAFQWHLHLPLAVACEATLVFWCTENFSNFTCLPPSLTCSSSSLQTTSMSLIFSSVAIVDSYWYLSQPYCLIVELLILKLPCSSLLTSFSQRTILAFPELMQSCFSRVLEVLFNFTRNSDTIDRSIYGDTLVEWQWIIFKKFGVNFYFFGRTCKGIVKLSFSNRAIDHSNWFTLLFRLIESVSQLGFKWDHPLYFMDIISLPLKYLMLGFFILSLTGEIWSTTLCTVACVSSSVSETLNSFLFEPSRYDEGKVAELMKEMESKRATDEDGREEEKG